MQRILFPTLGSAGDVFPLITLSCFLQERGHDCTIIASPVFENMVHASGVNFIALGNEDQYEQLTQDPRLWDASQAFRVVVEKGIIPFLQPLLGIYRSFDPLNTVIVSPLLLFASQVAHQKYGFRFATLQLQPSLLRSIFAPPVLGKNPLPGWLPSRLIGLYYRLLDRILIDPLLAPALNEFRQQNGLPPIPRIFQNGLFSDQLNICLFPEWFAEPQPDWPQNTVCTGFIAPPSMPTPVPASREDAVHAFLMAGEAPLVFTAGSALQFVEKFFSVAVQASQSLGKRAILLTPNDSQLPRDLPDDILHLPFYPLDQLLPHAAALVHSGGIGSLAQALAAGIPQLILPLTNDQPDNAARIQRLGLGDVILPRQLSNRNLINKLVNLLNNDGMRQRCHEYALRVNFDHSLAQTANLLEKLVR